MKQLKLGIGTLVVINLALWLSTDAANACSFLNFVHQGKMYIGRTNELPFETDETLIIVPRSCTLHGAMIQHGFVGINHGNDPFVSSGMNQHGLSVEGNALADLKYAPEGESKYNYLNIGAYILANAKKVDEAVRLLKKTKVSTTKIAAANYVEVDMHFSIVDEKRRIVVEWQDGTGLPKIFENYVGAMSNDPIYQDQLAYFKETLDMEGDTLDTGQVRPSEQKLAGFDKSSRGRFRQAAALNYTWTRP